MGFRFRKSFKIVPGVKVNFNKKSTGITFGGKGFHYTVNSKGKRTTSVAIPGTGLSYTSTNGGSKKKKTKMPQGSATIMETANTKKWYQKTGYIILLLILFFPVGLFLMWKYTDWSKNIKIAVSTIIAVLFGISILSSGGSDDGSETLASETGIESFDFLHSEALELDVGDVEDSYFTVDGTSEFSTDDISFVSSNEAVATFAYDKTVADRYIYYVIEAKSAGTATVYVQTADGIIKSEEIQVTVVGRDETTTHPETTTTQSETTVNADTTQKETTTKTSITANTETTNPVTTTKETTTQKPAGRTVYITPNGERYHFDPDCGGKNSRATSIDNVGGRTACKKCAQ